MLEKWVSTFWRKKKIQKFCKPIKIKECGLNQPVEDALFNLVDNFEIYQKIWEKAFWIMFPKLELTESSSDSFLTSSIFKIFFYTMKASGKDCNRPWPRNFFPSRFIEIFVFFSANIGPLNLTRAYIELIYFSMSFLFARIR